MNSPAGRSPRRASLLAALVVGGAQLLGIPVGAQEPVVPPPAATTPRDTAERISQRDEANAARAAMTPAPTPPVDQARGMDAELRVALFELTNDRYVAALSRLEWLQAAPATLTVASAPGALRGREDVAFLLAETYYRLGMDAAFRRTAEPLLQAGAASRYAPLLRSQLLLEAYRRGDYAAAKRAADAMASSATPSREAGLGALVSGLAAYQTGRYPEARASFATAQAGGAPYAAYAQYMDAIAQLRTDTTQTGAALQSLQTLASSASGELADQVRLTAAQVAYEGGEFAQAASLASAVSSTGGLASQALLTRAWALYKANQVSAAGEAFAEFARRFPELPERDEARLMSAQALLQGGRSDEAGRIFRSVADSLIAESGTLQGRAASAMAEGARALVAARTAGLLFLTSPASGKTLALEERAGASDSLLATAVNENLAVESVVAAAEGSAGAPDLVTFDDVRARLDSVGSPLGGGFPRRVLFTQASTGSNRADYATRASALYDADLQVAVARYRLEQQLDAQTRQLALLRALQSELANGTTVLGPLAAQVSAARDSLGRLASALDAAGERIRALFQAQLNETRAIAAENAASIDSVRRTLGTSLTTDDAEVLRIEGATASTYADVARQIDAGLNGTITRHPVFALRDSVRAHGDRVGALLGETQSALATAQTMVSQDISRLESGEGDRVTRARSTLATAETRRSAVESQLVAVVERELNARAGLMLASLRRDTEAAEFGAASAAFFQATDAGRTAGTPGTPGGSAGVNTGAPQDVAGADGTRPRAVGAGAPSSSSSLPRK